MCRKAVLYMGRCNREIHFGQANNELVGGLKHWCDDETHKLLCYTANPFPSYIHCNPPTMQCVQPRPDFSWLVVIPMLQRSWKIDFSHFNSLYLQVAKQRPLGIYVPTEVNLWIESARSTLFMLQILRSGTKGHTFAQLRILQQSKKTHGNRTGIVLAW